VDLDHGPRAVRADQDEGPLGIGLEDPDESDVVPDGPEQRAQQRTDGSCADDKDPPAGRDPLCRA
jgi:hypothetical protein